MTDLLDGRLEKATQMGADGVANGKDPEVIEGPEPEGHER